MGANIIFAELAAVLLARPLSDGCALTVALDADGTVFTRLERGAARGPVSVAEEFASAPAAPSPAPCVCTWERDECGFRCVWCDRVAWGEEHEALTKRFARCAAPVEVVEVDEVAAARVKEMLTNNTDVVRPAPVEAPVPAVDPMAPGQRVMRVGDLVVERIEGGATRDWIVESIRSGGPTLRRADRADIIEIVTWAHISLDAADLWRVSSPHDPVEPEPSRGDGRPVDEGAVNGVRVGDRITLDGVAVEVFGVDDEGFLWRDADADAVALEEGETMWREVRHVEGAVWSTRRAAPVEAPKPAKKPRAKKAPAAVVEPSHVDEAAAASGLWLLVEHPVGAPPIEARHEESIARRFYAATVAHGGEGLRRVELFDEAGLLVESHNYGVPAQPARGLEGVPASVPAHLRDLASLTVAEWWCVIAEWAVRPDCMEVKLCADESTARATETALRRGGDDTSAHDFTRTAIFTPAGEVHHTWHRYAPSVSEAVEAHPEAEFFRVTVGAAGVFAGTPPAEWGYTVAPCFFMGGHGCNSHSEVRQGTFVVRWLPDVATSEVYAIVPRAAVALVERRSTTWGGSHRIVRAEPASDGLPTVLRAGSPVDVGGDEWRVLLLDAETATLTRAPDEVAMVALTDLHPSGVGGGWWAERLTPKAEKTTKKAAKKGGAK